MSNRAIELLKEGEGSIPHMYLDTRSNVTVGVGQLLATVAAAQELPFVQRDTAQAATPQDIEADFNEVKNQPTGKMAQSYKSATKLDLPANEIDALLQRRIDGFEAELRGQFSEYDSYPEDAQLGVLDMAFNLGTNGLVTKFPTFTKAARAQDWATCANQCHRQGIGEVRNEVTKALFESAADPQAGSASANS